MNKNAVQGEKSDIPSAESAVTIPTTPEGMKEAIEAAADMDALRALRSGMKAMPVEVKQAYVQKEQLLRSQLSPEAKGIVNWNVTTHMAVTDQALSGHDELNPMQKSFLIDASQRPDMDPNEKVDWLSPHFYDALNEDPSYGTVDDEHNNALSRCVAHTNAALECSKAGNLYGFLKEVGYAVHYLQDGGTPTHTDHGNYFMRLLKLPMHVAFERGKYLGATSRLSELQANYTYEEIPFSSIEMLFHNTALFTVQPENQVTYTNINDWDGIQQRCYDRCVNVTKAYLDYILQYLPKESEPLNVDTNISFPEETVSDNSSSPSVAEGMLQAIADSPDLDALRLLRSGMKGMPQEVKEAYVAKEQELRSLLSPIEKGIQNNIASMFLKAIGLDSSSTGLISRPELNKYKVHFGRTREHRSFVQKHTEFFGTRMKCNDTWQQYMVDDYKTCAWKMHLFSIEDGDWQKMCQAVIPYLKEHSICWKTYNIANDASSLNGTKQQGKAFTIYPRNPEDMAQIAKDLDYIIRLNNLQTQNSFIDGDRQMGSTGRLFYRYELKSGKFADEIFDRNTPEGKARALSLYEYHRGNYLASDMTYTDDIWRDFNPSDINSQPYSKNLKPNTAYNPNEQLYKLPSGSHIRKGYQFIMDVYTLPTLRLCDGTVINLKDRYFMTCLMSLPDGASATVGRTGTIPIRANDTVSGEHIIITRVGNYFVLRDISTNGNTFCY